MIELIENIQQWAESKGIYNHSTTTFQKISMIGELCNEFLNEYCKEKQDVDALRLELGDVYVYAVNWLTMEGITSKDIYNIIREKESNINGDVVELILWFLEDVLCSRKFTWLQGVANTCGFTVDECLQAAYNKIAKRKTKMINGKAVKE